MDLRALFPPERDEDLALLLPPVPLLEVRLQGVRRPVFRPGLLKDLAVRLDLAEDGYTTRAGRGLEKGATEARGQHSGAAAPSSGHSLPL